MAIREINAAHGSLADITRDAGIWRLKRCALLEGLASEPVTTGCPLLPQKVGFPVTYRYPRFATTSRGGASYGLTRPEEDGASYGRAEWPLVLPSMWKRDVLGAAH